MDKQQSLVIVSTHKILRVLNYKLISIGYETQKQTNEYSLTKTRTQYRKLKLFTTMLSACTRTGATVRRSVVQQSCCMNSGFLNSNNSFVASPYLTQPLLFSFNFGAKDAAISHIKNQCIRIFSTTPPLPPPINSTGGNNSPGCEPFRRGTNNTFRLRRPDPRGGMNTGGRGGRGGGGFLGGGRGRGRGGFDGQSGGGEYKNSNRDFGLGGGNFGNGGGRNSPKNLNKKNIYGNPDPFLPPRRIREPTRSQFFRATTWMTMKVIVMMNMVFLVTIMTNQMMV